MKNLTWFVSLAVVLGCLLFGKLFYCQQDCCEEPESQKLALEGFDFPLKAYDYDNYRRADPATGKPKPGGVWKALKSLQEDGRLKNTKKWMKRSGSGWAPFDDFFASLSITRITFDPNNTNHYYFATGEGWGNADAVRGAGVWFSSDAGNSWNQIPSTDSTIFYQCQDLRIHPITSDIYVATRQGGLQRSQDGGNTWQKVLGNGFAVGAPNSICDIEFTASGDIFATSGIFESGGIFFSPSGDSGTFVKQTSGFPSSGLYRVEIATSPSADSIAYAIPIRQSNLRIEGFYATFDKGDNWIKLNNPGGNDALANSQGWYDLTIGVDPQNPSHVVAGGLNLWRSWDGGGNWQQITAGRPDSLLLRYVHVDQHEIMFQSSDTVFFGNDGGVWKCDNFTDPNPLIYSLNTGYNVTQFYKGDIHPTDPSKLVGGTQDNGSYLSTGSGLSPFQRITGADGASSFFNYLNPEILYTSTQYRRFYRFKSGGLFELPDTLTNGNLSNSDVQFINSMILDQNDPDIVYMASNEGVWRLDSASTASRDDWEQASRPAGTITALASSTNPPHIVFMGNRGGSSTVYKLLNSHLSNSSTSRISLDPSGTLPGGIGITYDCSDLFPNPNDANQLLITYTNYGVNSVWHSLNANGASPSWESIQGDLPDLPVNNVVLHPQDSNVVYIATDLGVFRTEKIDGDSTKWVVTNDGMANVRVDDLAINRSGTHLLASTHGRGMFVAEFPSSGYNLNWEERGPSNYGGRTRTIMVDPNDPNKEKIWAGSVSGGLWLTQSYLGLGETENQPDDRILAYPNPFGQEGLRVDLSKLKEPSTLQLFDINGNLIFSESNLTSSWTYKPGPFLPAGTYLLRVEGERNSQTIRLVYLR